ncbi:MAG: hypothetical protein J5858_12280 [Lentisphaeria bacterium]|nr:hypothetical protein [Lentisphaeria bacterium]
MKLTILATCLAAILAVPAFAQNLIPNGDFKKFDPDKGKPENWKFSRWNEVVEEGPGTTPVLRISSYYQNKRGAWKGNASVVIPEIAAGEYKFSLKTKGSANIIYFFLIPPKNSGAKRIIKDCRKIKMKPLEDGWKSGEYTLSFTENATEVILALECFFTNQGEYEYLADLRLEPVK